jgi:hypothetical protein
MQVLLATQQDGERLVAPGGDEQAMRHLAGGISAGEAWAAPALETVAKLVSRAPPNLVSWGQWSRWTARVLDSRKTQGVSPHAEQCGSPWRQPAEPHFLVLAV